MKSFIEKLGIKVIKTMAQAALGVIGSTALLTEVNWTVVASTVALSGLTCVLMNLAELKEQSMKKVAKPIMWLVITVLFPPIAIASLFVLPWLEAFKEEDYDNSK